MGIEKFKRHSLISLISVIILTVIGFLSTMFFAHTVGPTVYGAYALFFAYYGIFNLIGDGGFGGAVVKRISEGYEKNEFFSAFVILRIGLLVISVLTLVILQPYLIELDQSGLFSWLVLALVITLFFGITTNAVYGLDRVGIQQTSSIIYNISKIFIQIIGVYLGYGAAGLAGGFVSGLVIGSLVNLPFINLKFSRFNLRHVKQLLTFSFWVFLSTGGVLIYNYADTILIGYFLNTEQVGIYRIAFQLTTAATFTTTVLRTVIYPKMSKWNAHSESGIIEIALSRAFTYSLLLAVPVAVGGWILGERLLYFFYGASFAEGAGVLGILLLVQIVNVFMFLQTMTLNAIDRPRQSFYATGTAAVVNIALDLALIPLMGIKGAAIATLVTMIVNATIAHHYLSGHISVQIERGPTYHILLAAGMMAVVILLFRLLIPLSNVVLVLAAVALGGIVYGLVLMKADSGLHDEIRDLAMQLGAPWPKWL